VSVVLPWSVPSNAAAEITGRDMALWRWGATDHAGPNGLLLPGNVMYQFLGEILHACNKDDPNQEIYGHVPGL
jgi:hypothetical protein